MLLRHKTPNMKAAPALSGRSRKSFKSQRSLPASETARPSLAKRSDSKGLRAPAVQAFAGIPIVASTIVPWRILAPPRPATGFPVLRP